jgi:hypothetical protein
VNGYHFAAFIRQNKQVAIRKPPDLIRAVLDCCLISRCHERFKGGHTRHQLGCGDQLVIALMLKTSEGNDRVPKITKQDFSDLNLADPLDDLHRGEAKCEQYDAKRKQEFGA